MPWIPCLPISRGSCLHCFVFCCSLFAGICSWHINIIGASFQKQHNPPIPLALLLARQVPWKSLSICHLPFLQFSSVAQSCPALSGPWTAARQASLFITNSWSLLKLMSIKSVMPSSHLIPSPPAFNLSQHEGLFQWVSFLHQVAKMLGIWASASVLPMNTQDRSPLGWTGWVSLQSKGLSRGFSITTVQKHQFFSAQLPLYSNSHIHTWLLKNHSCD